MLYRGVEWTTLETTLSPPPPPGKHSIFGLRKRTSFILRIMLKSPCNTQFIWLSSPTEPLDLLENTVTKISLYVCHKVYYLNFVLKFLCQSRTQPLTNKTFDLYINKNFSLKRRRKEFSRYEKT